jgi:MFS family permease
MQNSASILSNSRPVRGKTLRRALWLATVAWIFGSIWFTAISGSPQTNYAKALHASEFQFGLLTALPFIASLLSLPASLIIEATGQRKKIFLWPQYLNRLMWFPIGLVPLWIVWRYPSAHVAAMAAFLWLMFIMHSCQAIAIPAWVSWMADIIPDRKRGKYFSRRRAWGLFSAIPAAVAVGWVLDRYALFSDQHTVLKWVAIVFMVAALFGLVDIIFFEFVVDVPRKPSQGIHLLRAMKGPLHDKHFLWMCGFVGMLFFAVSFMGQFLTKYVMEQLAGGTGAAARHVNLTTQMMVLVAPNLASLLVIGAWGRAADRKGKKPVLALAALGLVPVGFGWCLVSSGNPWLGYLLSMAGTALWQGVDAANWNLVMEMGGSADESPNGAAGGSAYVAVNSVIINLAGAAGGLSAGAIAQSLHDWQWVTAFKTFTYYDVLFALSALLRLVAVVVFLPHLHEPAARPTHEALRFMTSNLYNNLFNAVQQPLRILGLAKRGPETAEETVEADVG